LTFLTSNKAYLTMDLACLESNYSNTSRAMCFSNMPFIRAETLFFFR